MTNKRTALEDIVTPMGFIERISKAAEKASDTRDEVKKEGEKAIREVALDVNKYFQPEQYAGKKPDDLTPQEIEATISKGNIGTLTEIASNALLHKTDRVVEDLRGKKYLDALVLAEPIGSQAKGKETELVRSYSHYRVLENLVKKYDDEEILEEDEEKVLAASIGSIRAKEIARNFAGDLSDGALSAIGEIVAATYHAGAFKKEEIKKYSSQIVKDAKKKYEELSDKYDISLGDYVAKIMTKDFVKKLNQKELAGVLNAISLAGKGELGKNIKFKASKEE